MLWLQTGSYHLAGLYWLIAVAVIFVIALVALVLAGVAYSRTKTLSFAAPSVPEPSLPADLPGDRGGQPRTPEALRLLDGRYANGELTRDQYLQLEADLLSTSARRPYNARQYEGNQALADTAVRPPREG